MNNKALETVQKYNMLQKGDRVIVGLSGGADSCALLHFFTTLREAYGLDIYACHINHCLRGEEADKDEAFTKELCDRLGVKLFVLRADVGSEAARLKISTELCGRQIRYGFFESKAKELDAKIATAHTASDNLETVLFDLTRGCGVTGLGGIPPVRGNIIRPLISVSREEVEAYCKKHGLDYVTDSTNLTRDYTRNKLRLDVVPVLREINPSVEKTLAAFSERARELDLFLNDSAVGLLERARVKWGYSSRVLSSEGGVLLSHALRRLCSEFEIIPEAKHIELLKNIVYNGGALELRHGIFAVCSQGVFRIAEKTPAQSEDIGSEYPLSAPEQYSIFNKKLSTALINIDEYNNRKKIEKFMFHNSLDYDTIPLTGTFRTRRHGDTFQKGRNAHQVTVKKLMNELKVPKEQRDSLILLADGSSVLWIENIGVCEGAKVSPRTKRVLVINCDTKFERMVHNE